jgi:small nuclear ribonucleoprotein (snRNP)-like protein
MNLILSDVEETIMLVDGTESAPPGQGVVNVDPSISKPLQAFSHITSQVAKRKMEMLFVRGDGVILVRVSFSVVLSVSALPFCPRYRLHLGRNFRHRFMALDVVRFCPLSYPTGCVKHDMHIIAESSYESCVSNISL